MLPLRLALRGGQGEKYIFSAILVLIIFDWARCGRARVNFKGNGPIRAKMRARAFMRSFLDVFDIFYLSLDGESLFLYSNRAAAEADITIPLTHITAISVELIEHSGVKSKAFDDRHVLILSTCYHDMLRIK
jgi:hypothetical protein